MLRSRGEDLPGTRNSRIKLGQTAAGRYLQVVYVPDEDPDSVFVITAYELRGKARTAYRRRQRRRPEAAREAEGITMMAVPTELAPEVRALIARKHSA